MNRALLIVVFISISFSSLLLSSPTNEKPNILFILTDDQRWDTLGCYSNDIVRTPNLDALSSQGARLERFYVASPLCCPSRAVFLSGLYPHQTGIITNGSYDLARGTKTVAKLLTEAGYTTGFVGKAHLGGNPKEWDFKECPVFFPDGQTPYQNPELMVDGKRRIVQGFITTLFADAAIRFLESHRGDRWFLWLATTAPHQPLIQYPSFVYKDSQIKAPPGWPKDQEFKKSYWPKYYSTISMMDAEIGRVLKKLDELGLSSKTFVFFTSDNGYMFGSHGEDDKRVWYEESIRVPALARWPSRIKAGTRVTSLVSSADFLPTMLDLAGLQEGNETEGVSMLPALEDGRSNRNAIYAEVTFKQLLWQMVRTEQWKYVRFLPTKKQQTVQQDSLFYDLKNDPLEQKDLSQSRDYASQLQAMKNELEQWLKKTDKGSKKPRPVKSLNDQKD